MKEPLGRGEGTRPLFWPLGFDIGPIISPFCGDTSGQKTLKTGLAMVIFSTTGEILEDTLGSCN